VWPDEAPAGSPPEPLVEIVVGALAGNIPGIQR
jgi:hypothetical protein